MNKRKGITLIALVITIIIMLLLTAVGLSLAFGQDGLYKKAKLAKEKQLKNESEEKLKLTTTEVYADIIEKEGREITKEDVIASESFNQKFNLENGKIQDKQNGYELEESTLNALVWGTGTETKEGVTFNKDEIVFKIIVPDDGKKEHDILFNIADDRITVDTGDGVHEKLSNKKPIKPYEYIGHKYTKPGEYILRVKDELNSQKISFGFEQGLKVELLNFGQPLRQEYTTFICELVERS